MAPVFTKTTTAWQASRSPRFLKRKKLLQCHWAAWVAWTTKPNDSMNSNSRTRKGPAVLFQIDKW